MLGIDPGTRLCGWGIVARAGSAVRHVDNGVVVLDPKAPLAARLAVLMARLDGLIDAYSPALAAVETVFHNRNARSALTLGHARGVALAVAAHRGLEIHEYTPQQIKKAVTGSGRGSKEQVQQMITMQLRLPEPPQADAADAVAAALCHAQHLALGLPTVQLPPKPKGGPRKARAALEALVARQQAANTAPRQGGRPPNTRRSDKGGRR